MLPSITLLLVIAGGLLETQLTLAATNSVLLYNKVGGQLVTSSTLVWESYVEDIKQLEFAIPAAKYTTKEENYSMYVCRALIEGMYTTGHTQQRHTKERLVCVVSMHHEVKSHNTFDILLNKGRFGKLTWKSWNKFSAKIPSGAVSAVNTGHVDDFYVARHKVHHENAEAHQQHHHQHHQHGPDYNVGRFAPKQGLGKVTVTESLEARDYEEGEILCESEPIRYELKDIKIDRKHGTNKNLTELGRTILSNPDSYPNQLETVISYKYDKVMYWGTHEGVARGMPTTVLEGGGKSPVDIKWGLKEVHPKIEDKSISVNLPGGTAVNVTLQGNYTKTEAQYKATLVSYYEDAATESFSRKIEATFQIHDLYDTQIIFSPMYWIHNQTLLPTTTTTTTTTTSTTSTTSTTTTSTTSSTTQPSTTTNRDAQPANAPPLNVDGGEVDDENGTLNVEESANEINLASFDHQSKTNSSNRQSSNAVSVILLMMMTTSMSLCLIKTIMGF